MTDLFETLWSEAQLATAWEKVKSNDGAPGGDGVTLAQYGRARARNLSSLAARLRDGDYRPGPLRPADIPKPRGGTRRLMIPCIDDRVAQTAAAQVLDPILDPMFSPDSFAYRSGRSVDMAVRRVDALRRQGFAWVAETDIRRCFETIPHDPLLARLDTALAEHPGQTALVDLIALWLEHFGADLDTPGRGLAQGSPLAPLLCNFYLDEFDDALDDLGIRYVRFADDFVLLARTEAQAHRALGQAAGVLRDHGLDIHGDKTRVVGFDEGLEFLGHLFLRALVLRQINDPEENPAETWRAVTQIDQDNRPLPDPPAHDPDAYRVLYLTEADRRLDLRNLSFAVREGDRELAAMHPRNVDRIEIGPGAGISAEALRHALATETDLAFVDGRGRTEGWLQPPAFDRAGLHLAQARLILDDALAADLARRLVDLRLRNQRAQLHRLNRLPKDPDVIGATRTLGRILRKLPRADTVDALRGHEGEAGAVYWPALGRLCAGASGRFRRQRPARDPLNAALNYLTAMLERDVRAAILRGGLHPGFGLLHRPRDRHEACVYDLMEGFRAPLSEGLAVTLFNRNRLRPGMFSETADGIRIGRDGIRALIVGYEQTVSRTLRSTHSGKTRPWRAIMLEEVRAYARHCADPGKHPFQGQRLDY